MTAVIGPNGAGKTTLFKATAGLMAADSGNIFLSDDAQRRPLTSDMVRFAPQFTPRTRTISVGEILEYLALLDGMPSDEAKSAVQRVLEQCDLTAASRSRLSGLSGGEAKRVAIAQSLLSSSPVLILDEPTSGLDPLQRKSIGSLIQGLNEQKYILFSTHNFEEVVGWATWYVFLNHESISASGSTIGLSVDDLEAILGGAS